MVAYETRGQRSARYSCYQFVRRSSDVFQIRASVVIGRMHRVICHDSSLLTDHWLIVDRARLGRHRVPCPLHGGYSVHLFDKVYSTLDRLPATALLEWVSEYAVRAYTTSDSAVTYLNTLRSHRLHALWRTTAAESFENSTKCEPSVVRTVSVAHKSNALTSL